jgi:signal transduction histidine kinase
MLGRLLVALGILAGTSLLLRGDPVMPVFAPLVSFVVAYGVALLLILRARPNRLMRVFVAGFVLDNAVMLAAWWYFLEVHSGALETNDMYLVIIPVLMVGTLRLGWLAGGIYSGLWLVWFTWSSWHFYGRESYDVRQLPVRVTFIAITIVLSMRLVAITARERRLERIRVEELERLERFKSSVVQSISHELRTPLTTIKVCTEIIGERLAREGRAEFQRVTQSLSRATTRLERMIEQSTDFARARAGTERLNVQPVMLEPVIRGVVSLFSPELEAKGQSVELSFPPEQKEIAADPLAVERVVSILLDNAIKYSPQGVEIGVKTIDFRDSVRVAVSDRGPGIPAEDRTNVFSGLYRGAQADRLATPGAGLSLALARELIERHGGEIGVEPRDGTGATVYFILPREAKPQAAVPRE